MLSHFNLLKGLICAMAFAAVSLSLSAKLTGDGYYRVQNYMSSRYIYVLDNKGELNFQATTADLGALELWLGYERTISDPATVIYMTDVDGAGKDYDFQAQGTGVMAMINHAVSMMQVSGTETYRIFGRDSGVARYIGDGTESQGEKGRVGSTQPASSDWVKWYVYPITDEDDQYFGLTPEVAYNGEYYASLYAAFPFTPQSAGMTVYYVSKVDGDIAVLSEIKGTVPEGTPVIVKCASSQPVQNKLTLGGTADELSGNCLNGVYFKNESISHNNVTDYDKQTMRLLGTSADGKPAFVTAADTYLPRNKAYLPVSANAPAEIRIMTEAEYQASVDYVGADSDVKVYATGLTLNVDGLADGGQVEVYDAVGRSVYNGTTTVVSLPAAGVYVVRVNGLVRKIIAK